MPCCSCPVFTFSSLSLCLFLSLSCRVWSCVCLSWSFLSLLSVLQYISDPLHVLSYFTYFSPRDKEAALCLACLSCLCLFLFSSYICFVLSCLGFPLACLALSYCLCLTQSHRARWLMTLRERLEGTMLLSVPLTPPYPDNDKTRRGGNEREMQKTGARQDKDKTKPR
jgi:hypothetical protein